MGALLTLPITLLNTLLPFTRPGTPLIQDLIHTVILCGTLYYAPQIAEWYNTHHTNPPHDPPPIEHEAAQPPQAGPPEPTRQRDPLPLDDRLVLQPSDDEDDDAIPPPLAPTPPHIHHPDEPPLPQAIPQLNAQPDPFAPGPANPNAPRPTPQNRPIGAKKAKSLARKDQRRAYHEFHRQEAELRRLREQEGAAEREAEIAAEKNRRAKIEAEIMEKEREERMKRKDEERREIEEEQARRDRVVSRVKDEVQRNGFVDLLAEARKEGKDKMWVLKLVRASGLLAQLSVGGAKAMITGEGWLVRLDEEVMRQAYAEAEKFGAKNGGNVGFEELGGFMERAVRMRAKA
ncbi:hypothetical protein FB567DRAFT_551761 [Paraphoma chrysanthemicola]|uniref:Uncharacterized protein n=1 Tax=Paraphoma chrysanthemicola TaxID=798071 RepID=A0A8K0VVH8_9PLEO|nr:hypothetical protein FB567DRAFT_551761 [Paraphoma chrysanthemicola]